MGCMGGSVQSKEREEIQPNEETLMGKKRRKPDWGKAKSNSRFQQVARKSKQRTYNGNTYKFYGAYSTKKKAQERQKQVKKKGHLARIEKSPKVMRSVDPKTGKLVPVESVEDEDGENSGPNFAF